MRLRVTWWDENDVEVAVTYQDVEPGEALFPEGLPSWAGPGWRFRAEG